MREAALVRREGEAMHGQYYLSGEWHAITGRTVSALLDAAERAGSRRVDVSLSTARERFIWLGEWIAF